MAAPKDYPRLINLMRKGGRSSKGKFQQGMKLLDQVIPIPALPLHVLHPCSRSWAPRVKLISE